MNPHKKNNIPMKLDPVAKNKFERSEKVHFQGCHLGLFQGVTTDTENLECQWIQHEKGLSLARRCLVTSVICLTCHWYFWHCAALHPLCSQPGTQGLIFSAIVPPIFALNWPGFVTGTNCNPSKCSFQHGNCPDLFLESVPSPERKCLITQFISEIIHSLI